MTTTRVATLPTSWDDARDLPFFRITDRLFPADFCFGAGVLLASYDDILDEAATPAAPERRTVPATPASAHDHTHPQPERGLLPVQVRRTR
jgi:hypothetical protein